MNPTSAVILSLLIVLGSGILQFAFAANRLRSFRVTSGEFSRENATSNCTNNNKSLFTVFDEEDAKVLQNLAKSSIWIGLQNTNSNLTWSNGSPVIFNETKVNISDIDQICEAIENGTWTGFNCSDKKYFMCQNGSRYVPIEKEKNWCQALQYCRNHFMELARIDNKTQNEDFKATSQNGSFWIGLMHVLFEWDDQSCSTFRTIKKSRDPAENCSIFSHDGGVRQHNCDNEANALCTKGRVRIQIVNQSLTWEDALKYCEENHSRLLWIEDQNDHVAVKKWLRHTYNGPLKQNFWIGLRQSTIFGFWIWSDRIVNWSNWRDQKTPELPMSHHCGVISGQNFKWSDENCFQKLPFLCEEDIVKMKKDS